MKQILCFGDSNTWGLIAGTKERYGWNERWTGILQDKVQEKGIRIIEEGLCGRTTVFNDKLRDGRCGSKILPVILESHYPINTIVLMLGTNDCKTLYNATAEIIGKGIECLLEQIKAISPKSKIILVSPIHLGELVWQENYDPEFNERSVKESKRLKEVYEKIAEKYNIEFLAASDYANPSKEDMEHLDLKGHKVLADAVYKKLEKIV